jgi:exosortase
VQSPPSQPSPQPPHDRAWQRATVGVLAAVLFAFSGFGGLGGLIGLAQQWTRADYSHGFVVLPFAAYLLWRNRADFPAGVKWPDHRGLYLIVSALVVYLIEAQINYAKEWVQGACLVAALGGVAVMFCGRWAGLRWAAPALVMLLLALPLPNTIEWNVSWQLRKVAASAAAVVFRLLGLATHLDGPTVIEVERARLGVEQACSGLSMLMAFVALMAAVVLLCPPSRPKADRWIIFASAVPIAVLCNVLRIVASGLVLLAGWQKAFDFIVHEFAGLLMPVLALGLVWLEFKLIDWLLVPVQYMTREEVVKAGLAEAKAEIERQAAERQAMHETLAARTGRVAADTPHPAAPFLPLTPSGTAHGATAAGGTHPTPPPRGEP